MTVWSYPQLNKELLQIAKFDLLDGLYPNVSNLYECFYKISPEFV